jgi:hypothetical protein
MKELKFIQSCPDDTYYTWQVNLWLESLKELGHSDKAISLIFTPKNRVFNEKWKVIEALYPEATFCYYKDEENISPLLSVYIPTLRPYTLMRYFKDNPKSSNKAYFYCDADILFTKDFNLDKFQNDDVCYLSDTNSYINSDYFDNKVKDVMPSKLELYKTKDILEEMCNIIGITREIAEKNKLNSGGAQYFLKNLDADFWKKVMNDCINIKVYLQGINKEFFESENKGFQSWCADMWSVLWNLWLRNQETKVVKELAFAWSTDPIKKLETHTILHNAGVTGKFIKEIPYFYKGTYHLGSNPLNDNHIDVVLNNEKSKLTCNWFYTNKLKELQLKYNINY